MTSLLNDDDELARRRAERDAAAAELRKLLDPALWGGSVATAAELGAVGSWGRESLADVGDREAVRRTLEGAVARIHDATRGAVGREDLVLVVGRDLAGEMGLSHELYDYMKRHPEPDWHAQANSLFGLPPLLYGLHVAVQSTMAPGPDGPHGPYVRVMPPGVALLLCRHGVAGDELGGPLTAASLARAGANRRAGFLITRCLG